MQNRTRIQRLNSNKTNYQFFDSVIKYFCCHIKRYLSILFILNKLLKTYQNILCCSNLQNNWNRYIYIFGQRFVKICIFALLSCNLFQIIIIFNITSQWHTISLNNTFIYTIVGTSMHGAYDSHVTSLHKTCDSSCIVFQEWNDAASWLTHLSSKFKSFTSFSAAYFNNLQTGEDKTRSYIINLLLFITCKNIWF